MVTQIMTCNYKLTYSFITFRRRLCRSDGSSIDCSAGSDLTCSSQTRSIVVALLAFTFFGCDPTRTTTQTVTLLITDKQQIMSIPNIKVRLQQGYVPRLPGGSRGDIRGQDRWEYYAPWHEGVSDASGHASVAVVIIGMDRNRGSTPPQSRDILDDTFVVQVVNMDGHMEQSDLRLTPGTVGETESFIIKVEEISQPQYIQ